MRIHTSLTADQLHAIAREVDIRLHARITTHKSKSADYGHTVARYIGEV